MLENAGLRWNLLLGGDGKVLVRRRRVSLYIFLSGDGSYHGISLLRPRCCTSYNLAQRELAGNPKNNLLYAVIDWIVHDRPVVPPENLGPRAIYANQNLIFG